MRLWPLFLYRDFLPVLEGEDHLVIEDRDPAEQSADVAFIAKYRFNASYNENMHLTSLWFFYASLVSLYTGSFESTVENHLNSIKELTSLEDYKRFILSRVEERLTNDYFDITLIGSEGLAVSGRGNNAWNNRLHGSSSANGILEDKMNYLPYFDDGEKKPGKVIVVLDRDEANKADPNMFTRIRVYSITDQRKSLFYEQETD